jgi:hypothetical protein
VEQLNRRTGRTTMDVQLEETMGDADPAERMSFAADQSAISFNSESLGKRNFSTSEGNWASASPH